MVNLFMALCCVKMKYYDYDGLVMVMFACDLFVKLTTVPACMIVKMVQEERKNTDDPGYAVICRIKGKNSVFPKCEVCT